MTEADRYELERLLDVLHRDVRAVRSNPQGIGLVLLDVEDAEGLLRLGRLASLASVEWRGVAKRALRVAERRTS